MSRHSINRRWALWAGALALVLVALYGAVRFAQALPEGPVAIAWDREPCGHCHMHIGDPAFAAQLQTSEGEVLSFDDPGCLLKYEAEQRPSIHAVYFRHVNQDRWLSRAEVAFVPMASTPMGYGVGAVERGTGGAISYAAAQDQVTGVVRGMGRN